MKKSLTKIIIPFLAVFSFTLVCKADIKLPAIFCDGMVLQQKMDAAIWGTASHNSNVEVMTSWNNKTYTTKTNGKGKWKLFVKTPEAGGPYYISLSDGKEIKLNDILIGEVWLCSGQSNMVMPLKGFISQPIYGSNKTIVNATNDNIRLFTVERNTSLQELDNFSGKWLACNPENVSNFSAAAYHFGKMLQEVLQVPVGLISSNWGGTIIESWMNENAVKEFEWIPKADANKKAIHREPTVLFNAMIAPMAGYTIKGTLWYQGEANRFEPKKYEKLLPGLIKSWRSEWGIGKFPFYYAQIAPYNYNKTGFNSALFREAQLKTSTSLENIGMISLMDIGQKNTIHPANKQVVGERFAYLALAKTYEIKGFAYSGPVLRNMDIKGPIVKLTFDFAENGLNTFGKELINFKIAGKNKLFYPADVTLTRQGITLFSAFVPEPVAIRYAFDDFVVGELFNTEGLPASSFRTDNWSFKE